MKALSSSLGRKVTKVTSVIEQASSVTGAIVGEKIDNAFDIVRFNVGEKVDDIKEFAAIKIKAMISNLPFDETLDAIEKYQKESGKDTGALQDFIIALKQFFRKMTNSKNISAISNFVDNFPLQDILETAEIVVKYIPSPINLPVDIIIKVIKVLLKLQPAAGKAIKAGASIVQNCEEYNLCKDNTSDAIN